MLRLILPKKKMSWNIWLFQVHNPYSKKHGYPCTDPAYVRIAKKSFFLSQKIDFLNTDAAKTDAEVLYEWNSIFLRRKNQPTGELSNLFINEITRGKK